MTRYLLVTVLIGSICFLQATSGRRTSRWPNVGSRKLPVAQRLMRYMFDALNLASPCTASRLQRKLCRDKSVRNALQQASQLAATHCQEQFQYDPWNCSGVHKNFNFVEGSKVYRETALLYAMSAAALTHVVAQACADGSMRGCRCAEEPKPEDTRRIWFWGLCGDNYNYGRHFTRRFTQLRQSRGADHLHGLLVRHNMNVGIQAVGQMKSVCKCHGVSGSCATKTCWKSLRPFKETAEILKGSYYKAQLKVASNRASWRRSSGRPLPKGTLVYVQNSPDFCPATRGRRCLHPENCGILCCCRGYISLSVAEDRHCNCHWVHRYHKLSCSTCTFKKEIYVCK